MPTQREIVLTLAEMYRNSKKDRELASADGQEPRVRGHRKWVDGLPKPQRGFRRLFTKLIQRPVRLGCISWWCNTMPE
jgi:hypothetical protein